MTNTQSNTGLGGQNKGNNGGEGSQSQGGQGGNGACRQAFLPRASAPPPQDLAQIKETA